MKGSESIEGGMNLSPGGGWGPGAKGPSSGMPPTESQRSGGVRGSVGHGGMATSTLTAAASTVSKVASEAGVSRIGTDARYLNARLMPSSKAAGAIAAPPPVAMVPGGGSGRGSGSSGCGGHPRISPVRNAGGHVAGIAAHRIGVPGRVVPSPASGRVPPVGAGTVWPTPSVPKSVAIPRKVGRAQAPPSRVSAVIGASVAVPVPVPQRATQAQTQTQTQAWTQARTQTRTQAQTQVALPFKGGKTDSVLQSIAGATGATVAPIAPKPAASSGGSMPPPTPAVLAPSGRPLMATSAPLPVSVGNAVRALPQSRIDVTMPLVGAKMGAPRPVPAVARPSPPAAAVAKNPLALPPIHPAVALGINSSSGGPIEVVEDPNSNRALRSPLVGVYGSLIAPQDTSLSEARVRLHTALDQTRLLRKAFTDRIYKKYRILCRPVPRSVDDVVGRIQSDPVSFHAALEGELRNEREEKEMEKREAQKLNSAVQAAAAEGASGGDTRKEGGGIGAGGTSAPNTTTTLGPNVDNADQLSWFRAGLSLVILPEEEIDETEYDISEYKHRGPIDRNTGHRVGGISSASAAAAEVMLDRVRRGYVLRTERKKRLRLDGGNAESGVRLDPLAALVTPLHLFPSGVTVGPVHSIPQGLRSARGPSSAPLVAGKSSKKLGSKTAATAERSKPIRVAIPLPSPANLLSLAPEADGAGIDGVGLSASSAALRACGVGSRLALSRSGRAAEQQRRWRHPHPSSIAGRRISGMAAASSLSQTSGSVGGGSSSKKGSSGSTSAAAAAAVLFSSKLPSELQSWALPPIPDCSVRERWKPARTLSKEAVPAGAVRAVERVLQQFFTPPVAEDYGVEKNTKDSVDAKTKEQANISVPSCKKENERNEAVVANSSVDFKESDVSERREVTKKVKGSGTGLKRRLNEIGLLHGLLSIGGTKENLPSLGLKSEPEKNIGLSAGVPDKTYKANNITDEIEEVNPMLAFSVLHALGMIRDSTGGDDDRPQISEEVPMSLLHVPGIPGLVELSDITLNEDTNVKLNKRNFSDAIMHDIQQRNLKRSRTQRQHDDTTLKGESGPFEAPFIANIRGGGNSLGDFQNKLQERCDDMSAVFASTESRNSPVFDSLLTQTSSFEYFQRADGGSPFIATLRGGGESVIEIDDDDSSGDQVLSASANDARNIEAVTPRPSSVSSIRNAMVQSISSPPNMSPLPRVPNDKNRQGTDTQMVAAIWGDQVVGMPVQSALPSHVASAGLGGAYSVMPQGAISAAAAAGIQHHSHTRHLGGGANGNDMFPAGTLHLAQNSLQHAAAAAALHVGGGGTVPSHSTNLQDLGEYFASSLRRSQPPTAASGSAGAYAILPAEWAAAQAVAPSASAGALASRLIPASALAHSPHAAAAAQAAASMGLTSHQAATMVNQISARERAATAQAMLAREQQHAAVVAAHAHAQAQVQAQAASRHHAAQQHAAQQHAAQQHAAQQHAVQQHAAQQHAAAAVRANSTIVQSLSSQQAAVFLSNHNGGRSSVGPYAQPVSQTNATGTRFLSLGARSQASAAALMAGGTRATSVIDLARQQQHHQQVPDITLSSTQGAGGECPQTPQVSLVPSMPPRSMSEPSAANQSAPCRTFIPEHSSIHKTLDGTIRPSSAGGRLASSPGRKSRPSPLKPDFPNRPASAPVADSMLPPPPQSQPRKAHSSPHNPPKPSVSLVPSQKPSPTVPPAVSHKMVGKSPDTAPATTEKKENAKKTNSNELNTKFNMITDTSSKQRKELQKAKFAAEFNISRSGKAQPQTIVKVSVDREKKNGNTANQMNFTSKLTLKQTPKLSSAVASSSTSVTPRNAVTAAVLKGSSCCTRQTETTGMKFIAPTPPAGLMPDVCSLILKAGFHVAVEEHVANQDIDGKLLGLDCGGAALLIRHLTSIGSAVPIPKALVANPLKESLMAQYLMGGALGTLSVREIITAAISTWLWSQHQKSFLRAFGKSGRIDVDHECKWLIHAAVDAAARSLASDLSSENSLSAIKGVGVGVVEIGVACLVSQTLMKELCVDEEMDSVMPNLTSLVQYLDERRFHALRVKNQERSLLAALVSRRVRMSEAFSHAYTSSMVRAGEAFGYEELCEIVQDEMPMASSLLPFDIFNDHTGAWEDPCRLAAGYVSGLTGDELTWKAHARALIQKSLKKLQDRYSIKGGTPHAGPYRDPPSSSTPGSGSGGSGESSALGRGASMKAHSSLLKNASALKRKGSTPDKDLTFTTFDSGSASAGPNSSLLNPSHYCSPLHWDCDSAENKPYGRYENGGKRKKRSSSGVGGKRFRRSTSTGSGRSSPLAVSVKSAVGSKGRAHITEEILWNDVANMFEPVSLGAPETRSSTSAKAAILHNTAPSSISGKTGVRIIAPFCHNFDLSDFLLCDDFEDESDEDLCDETVMARHQVVLDKMKEKLDHAMEVRPQGRENHRSSNKR